MTQKVNLMSMTHKKSKHGVYDKQRKVNMMSMTNKSLSKESCTYGLTSWVWEHRIQKWINYLEWLLYQICFRRVHNDVNLCVIVVEWLVSGRAPMMLPIWLLASGPCHLHIGSWDTDTQINWRKEQIQIQTQAQDKIWKYVLSTLSLNVND